MFDALVFAGGGNRCYWQGGFYEAARTAIGDPSLVVGASAGAFAAAYSLLGLGPLVRKTVIEGSTPEIRNVDWRAWRRKEPLFPVGALYRSLIENTLDRGALERLKRITDLRIACTRLPARWPPVLGAAFGISAYQLEKRLFHPVHPRFGRSLGFRQEFISVRDLQHPTDLADAIMASSGVPPFMPVTAIGGAPAFDGGLVDNVPVALLPELEGAGARTLVLLTRRYRELPSIPGRTYVQPSEPIQVKQFDLRNPQAIVKAYELGVRDGQQFAETQGG